MKIAYPISIMKKSLRTLIGKLNFQAKLLIVFVFLLGVVTVLFGFIHYQSEKVLLRKSVGNLRNMVNIVHYSTQSLSTERPINRSELDHFLAEVIRKESAIEASLVDFDHQIVASTNQDKIGSTSTLPSDSIGVWGPSELADERPDKVQYVVRIPLVRHKQVEGIVEISLFLNDLSSYLWKFNWEQLLLVLAAMGIAFAVFSLLLKRLHKPFRDMADAAKKVASGDFTVRLNESDRGEEGEMASSFNHMAQKLLEQRQMEERHFAMERRALLSELGANMAHEIRNPLNLMNLTLHHLGKTFKPQDRENEEAVLKLISSLKNEVQHLNGIVSDFLSLGKSAKPAKKRFRLKNLVNEISIRLHQQVAIKGIRLDLNCPEDIELEADQEQIRLVLFNLFLNSIDMVPSESSIEFTASREMGKSEVQCSVSDEGPGIEPGDLEKVFEPYYTKRAGGMGLGLTMVRRIVEEHGGEIHAFNRAEGGAEFRFTVPLGA
jgi:signal transduction histidine kinase